MKYLVQITLYVKNTKFKILKNVSIANGNLWVMLFDQYTTDL